MIIGKIPGINIQTALTMKFQNSLDKKFRNSKEDGYLQMNPNLNKLREENSHYGAVEKSYIVKIVSGGQAGADRGGLDAAIELGIPHGGYCPKGRRAEDGTIPEKYNQTETASKNYLKRTEQNVVESSATSIFTPGPPTGGSQKTAEFAKKHKKPFRCLDIALEDEKTRKELVEWINNLHDANIVLNVAGSRESKSPGIGKKVAGIVKEAVMEINCIPVPDAKPEMVKVLFFPDLRVACGVFRDSVSVEEIQHRLIEIPCRPGEIDPKRHFVVMASGDSMDGGNAPIRDGDLILLEKNEGGTVSNQIFAVEYQDDFGEVSYALKRVEKDAPGRYRLVSANKKFDDIPVDSEHMFPFARLKKIY